MARTVSLNGSNYSVPEPGDTNYDQSLTNYLVALATAFPQISNSTTQALGAELDLGQLFGVKLLYAKSQTANPATTGQVRLAKTDSVSWRNNANTADLALGISGSDVLQFAGASFLTAPLSSEVDFGATAGFKTAYMKSRAATIAAAGLLRFAGGASADSINWRNNANTADLPLTVNASDQLLFNGVQVSTGAAITNPCAILSKTTAQTLAAAAAQSFANSVIVAFDTVELDTDTGWNNATSRYTVPVGKAGHYLVTAALQAAAAPSANIGLYTAKNAILDRAFIVSTGSDVSISSIINAAAGDIIDARVCFFSTAASTTSATSGQNFLMIKRLG